MSQQIVQSVGCKFIPQNILCLVMCDWIEKIWTGATEYICISKKCNIVEKLIFSVNSKSKNFYFCTKKKSISISINISILFLFYSE